MVPAAALGHPDDLAAVGEVAAEFLAAPLAVGEEGLGPLVDDGPGRAGGAVDLDDPVGLVAALVVLEGEGPAVRAPDKGGDLVRIREERGIDLDAGLGVDVEEDRALDIEDVAGLGVFHGVVFRLKLVGRRGLDVLDDPVMAPAQAVGGEFLRVGRPGDGVESVIIALGAVAAEDGLRLLALGAEDEVVVADGGLPLPVGRGLPFLGGGLGRGPALPHGQGVPGRVPGSRGVELLEGVGREVAGPAASCRAELDRLAVLAEGQDGEGQGQGLELLAGGGGEGGRKTDVVECEGFLLRSRVGDPELGAADDGFPVPVAGGLAYPAAPIDDVESERLVLRPQAGRPGVIGLGDLGGSGAGSAEDDRKDREKDEGG